MEEFIPYELAVKLKEKGFNIPFYFYYRTDDKFLRHANVTNPLVYCDKIDDEVVIAPTISQVLKWLREEKKIFVTIDYYPAGYNAMIYTGLSQKDGFFDNGQYINECDCYNTYEQAAIAGIEYVIDNLIIVS